MVRTAVILTAAILALSPQLASANGNHYGWCIGVGNPHQGTNCAPPDSGTTNTPTPDVPVSNQLPATGTGPQPTPDTTPAQVIVTPNPPGIVTGSGPVPGVLGQTAPPITGTGVPPIVVDPIPQVNLTGVGPVPQVQTVPTPQLTGYGKTPVVVQPLPPTTVTGFSPVPGVQLIPTPPLTGQGLPAIVVVPNPPTQVTGHSPVSATIVVHPDPGKTLTGYGRVPVPTPQLTPGQVPQLVPTATPNATPVLVPPQLPTTPQTPQVGPAQGPHTPTEIPRPRPRPTTTATTTPTNGGGPIKHAPEVTMPARGHEQITIETGRQTPHAPPRFASEDGAGDWACLASGFGKRRTAADADSQANGALRHVGAVDVLGRDLPALHPDHTSCIITVRRRKDN